MRRQLETGKEYELEWSDGSLSRQRSCFMFGAFTKRQPLAIGDHVLAVCNRKSMEYMPGVVMERGSDETHLRVKFCNEAEYVFPKSFIIPLKLPPPSSFSLSISLHFRHFLACRRDDVLAEQCFWLSSEYFERASRFYRLRLTRPSRPATTTTGESDAKT